jgi:hypothetical protein
MGDHAAAADAGVVEQEMDPVRVVLPGDLVAKPFDRCRIGYIGNVGGDAQALAQSPAAHNRWVSSIAGAKTSHIATLQPSAASWRTSSRPMPEPSPVTIAIRSVKSFIGDLPWITVRDLSYYP